MPGPNFFIAGAPKAGTTSLYHHLQQHPQIYMSPVKEPAYFASEVRPDNFAAALQPKMRRQMEYLQASIRQGVVAGNSLHGIVADSADYAQLFSGVREEKAVGEASVCYLWSQTAPLAISRAIPHAKIILILRHPAERAFSEYLHLLSDGYLAHSFARHIQAGLHSGADAISYTHPFLEYGLYAAQVERYLAHFPHSQVRIWIYEDTLRQPEFFLREVLEFLDVDSSFVPDTAKRHHQMRIPRLLSLTQKLRRTGIWKSISRNLPAALRPLWMRLLYAPKEALQVTPEDRQFLIDFYRDDICRLQQMIGRDLSAWMV